MLNLVETVCENLSQEDDSVCWQNDVNGDIASPRDLQNTTSHSTAKGAESVKAKPASHDDSQKRSTKKTQGKVANLPNESNVICAKVSNRKEKSQEVTDSSALGDSEKSHKEIIDTEVNRNENLYGEEKIDSVKLMMRKEQEQNFASKSFVHLGSNCSETKDNRFSPVPREVNGNDSVKREGRSSLSSGEIDTENSEKESTSAASGREELFVDVEGCCGDQSKVDSYLPPSPIEDDNDDETFQFSCGDMYRSEKTGLYSSATVPRRL